jgi:hypothetical protein
MQQVQRTNYSIVTNTLSPVARYDRVRRGQTTVHGDVLSIDITRLVFKHYESVSSVSPTSRDIRASPDAKNSAICAISASRGHIVEVKFAGCQHEIRTLRDTVPAHWIQLSELVCFTSFASRIKRLLRHVCLDQARAYRVYANVGLL